MIEKLIKFLKLCPILSSADDYDFSVLTLDQFANSKETYAIYPIGNEKVLITDICGELRQLSFALQFKSLIAEAPSGDKSVREDYGHLEKIADWIDKTEDYKTFALKNGKDLDINNWEDLRTSSQVSMLDLAEDNNTAVYTVTCILEYYIENKGTY